MHQVQILWSCNNVPKHLVLTTHSSTRTANDVNKMGIKIQTQLYVRLYDHRWKKAESFTTTFTMELDSLPAYLNLQHILNLLLTQSNSLNKSEQQSFIILLNKPAVFIMIHEEVEYRVSKVRRFNFSTTLLAHKDTWALTKKKAKQSFSRCIGLSLYQGIYSIAYQPSTTRCSITAC